MYFNPWYPPAYMPDHRKEQDPIQMLNKFQKFLDKENQKKKEKEKKKEPVTLKHMNQVALLLLITMPITGPLYWLAVHWAWSTLPAAFR